MHLIPANFISEKLEPIQYKFFKSCWFSEEYTGPIAEVATSTNSEVYFIRYRLAPENIFPIPVEDCVELVKWLFDNSEQLNIDKDNIQLFGDSAGGNLVTNVALELLQQVNLLLPKWWR